MKIELSEAQFEKLLRLVYLGNWVVNGVRSGAKGDPKMEKYDEIEELFLKLAFENGYKDWVGFEERSKKFFPTKTFEMDEEMQSYIDEYNDDTFWEELGARLAERDVIEEMGEEVVSRLDNVQRFKILSEAEDKYFEEFEENGIDNIRLVQPVPPGIHIQ